VVRTEQGSSGGKTEEIVDDQDEKRNQIRQHMDEIRRKLGDTFDRAVDDPSFRQTLLDDPRAAFGVTGGDPERKPSDEFLRLRRDLFARAIDRAGSDPAFRSELKEHPRKALWEGGFGPQLELMRAEMPQPEVRGYTAAWWGGEWINSSLINPWGSGGWGGGWSGGWG
jgi:hypothetical protein